MFVAKDSFNVGIMPLMGRVRILNEWRWYVPRLVCVHTCTLIVIVFAFLFQNVKNSCTILIFEYILQILSNQPFQRIGYMYNKQKCWLQLLCDDSSQANKINKLKWLVKFVLKSGLLYRKYKENIYLLKWTNLIYLTKMLWKRAYTHLVCCLSGSSFEDKLEIF